MSDGLTNGLRLGATGLLAAAAFAMACRSEDAGVGLRASRVSFQVPDTVRGRALTLDVTATSPSAVGIVGLSYSLDGSEPTVAGASTNNGGVPVSRMSDSTWRLYVSEGLRPGRHEVVIVAYDADGAAVTMGATFESRIDTVRYHIGPLPTLGGAYARAVDLNEAGVVAGGAADVSGVFRAVKWSEGQPVQLSDNGYGIALALNDAGVVVGLAQDARMTGRCGRAVIWHDGGAPTLLPGYPAATPPDTTSACYAGTNAEYLSYNQSSSFPEAVNDRGSILTARYLDRNGSVVELIPGRDDRLTRWALNDRDQAVVSVARSPAYDYNSSAVGIGLTVGLPHLIVTNYSGAGRRYEIVEGVNESGMVVGTEEQFLVRAFRSDSAGRPTDLGPITGDLRARGLNDAGDVLLSSARRAGPIDAHLLRSGGLAAIALVEPGWRLVDVRKLNNAGLIIGSATDPSGASQEVLLTPAP